MLYNTDNYDYRTTMRHEKFFLITQLLANYGQLVFFSVFKEYIQFKYPSFS